MLPEVQYVFPCYGGTASKVPALPANQTTAFSQGGSTGIGAIGYGILYQKKKKKNVMMYDDNPKKSFGERNCLSV